MFSLHRDMKKLKINDSQIPCIENEAFNPILSVKSRQS